MRKLVLVLGLLALAAPPVGAGERPDRGAEGRRGMMDRGMMDRGMDRFFGSGQDRREQADPFDAARQFFDLTPEQRVALDALSAKQEAEERQAVAELRTTLAKKYAPQIAALLPEADRAKFEALIAAVLERHQRVAAAVEILFGALETVRQADEALDQKLIEVLGEEKARAARARMPWDRRGAGMRDFGAPPPPPGEGPPPGGGQPPAPQPREDF